MARGLAVLVLVLLGLLAGGLLWVAGSEGGARWLAGRVVEWSAGTVRLQGLAGTLRDGLDVAQLDVQTGRVTVHGEALRLRWRPSALLVGRVVVRELHAAVIEVVITPDPQAADEPFVMPTIATPLPVDVKDLRIERLQLRFGNSPLELRSVALSGALAGTRLSVRRLGLALDRLGIGIEGQADLVAPLPLEARLAWQLAPGTLSGAGTVRGNLDRLEVLQLLRVPEPVALAGSVSNLAAQLHVEARATAALLPFEVPGLGELRGTAVQLDLQGSPADWRATLQGKLAGPTLGEAVVEGRGHGDLGRIVFDTVRVRGVVADLAARGVLQFSPDPRLRLDVIAARLDPALLQPGLQGRIAGRVEVDTDLAGETRVRVREARGELMQRRLEARGEVLIAAGQYVFSDVQVQAGPNRLLADGALGERLSGRFELEAPQLGILWPGLAGRLSARARLAGSRERPVVDLQAQGEALALGSSAVRHVEIEAHIDRSQRADVQLRALGLVTGETALGELQASLRGSVASHRLTATLAGPVASAQLVSAGRWTGKALDHRLEQAQVAADAVGAWQLAGQPSFTLASDAASIAAHCWVQAPARLCVDAASWTSRRSQIRAALRELDLQRFNRWMAEDLAIAGQAEADVALVLDSAGLSGTASWRQHGTLVYYTGGDEPLVTPIERVDLSADFSPTLTTAGLQLAGAEGLRLAGTARFMGPLDATTALDARLEGQLPDLAPLLPLLAGDLDLADVAGSVTLDATVSGSLHAPRLAGAVRLAAGALTLPGLGLRIEAMDVALLGDGTEAFRLQGTARAGGPLSMEGEVRPLEPGGARAAVRIRGNNLDAVKLPDRYVQASPDFTLSYTAGTLAVDGTVVIPKAEIVVRELPQTAISPSPDTVVVDRVAASAEQPQQTIGGELTLTLGRDVRLKAFGLDTLLEGTVKLSQAADGLAQGFGVVRLKEGKFGAYGKELTIERGTLGFAGPLDDPAVDLSASRRVDWEGRSVKAGIRVSGTAKRPESRVFSDPAMSEADAISYLVSGRPMQSANATDRSAIAGAALSLGVAQSSPLTQKLGSAVTLDELGVESGTLEETEVVAGKQLNEDLYVRFAYGLFSRIGTVLARYRIGRNLSIEAASGEDQSLDLIYSVEKD